MLLKKNNNNILNTTSFKILNDMLVDILLDSKNKIKTIKWTK